MNAIILYGGLTCFILLYSLWIDNSVFSRKKIAFLLVLMWVFYALSRTGTDYVVYLRYYSYLGFSDVFTSGQEVGYVVLNCILHTFIKDPYIGLATIKSISFVVSMQAILRLNKHIRIGNAIFLWYCLVFYNGYLIAMSLAASLVLMGISHLIEGKQFFVLIYLLLACTIHYSACVILLFYLVFLLVGHNTYSKYLRFLFYCALVVLTALLPTVLNSVVGRVSFLNKYSKYTENITSTIGFMQIIFYIPVGLSLFYLRKNLIDKSYARVFRLFSWQGFFVALMAYVVGSVFDRMFVYFIASFVFLVPYTLKDIADNRPERKTIFTLRSDNLLLTFYAIFRVYIFLKDHYVISDLSGFAFFWQ